MSTFSELDARAATLQASMMAVSVDYTPQGSTEITFNCIWEDGDEEEIDFNDTTIRASHAVVQIPVASVASPKIRGDTGAGDTLKIHGDSVVWYVKDVLLHGGRAGVGMHRLAIDTSPGRIE